MSTVADEIIIHAEIGQVWETVMDPYRLGDWVTIHKSVENVTPPLPRGCDHGPDDLGAGHHLPRPLAPGRAGCPHRVRWEGEGPAHSVALIEYELAADPSGTTTFRYTNEFHPPGGRLGSVAGRFIVGATSEREARHSLLRLKSLLEDG